MMSELKHCQAPTPANWNGQPSPRATAPASPRPVVRIAPQAITVLGVPDARIRPLGVND